MAASVKHCPNCRSERPASEVMCDGLIEGELCRWSLFDVPLSPAGASEPKPPVVHPPPADVSRCANSHPLVPGDLMCAVCSAGPASEGDEEAATADSPAPTPEIVAIDQWQVVRPLPDTPGARRFEVRSEIQTSALLTLYDEGAEPDLKIFETLQRQHPDHVERIHAVGRWHGPRGPGGQTYCVTELVSGGTLAAYLAGREPDLASATVLLREVGTALASFTAIGLRHRTLQPAKILVRMAEPLDLVITGFESARLSDLDLDVVAPLQVTRYSAPEAMVGAVSTSSDWWSLGVILLEHLTRGVCFAGVSDQAFMLGTVTRGIAIPKSLDSRLDNALRGLLAHDPAVRWQWTQLSRWLEGQTVEAPASGHLSSERDSSHPLSLNGQSYFRADEFALAAAEKGNWDAGQELGLRGSIVTWAEQSRLEPATLVELRRAARLEGVSDDLRQAVLLQALNRDLPLCLRGEIVSPGWLLKNPAEAYEIITSPAIGYLRQSGRAPWLVQVADRVQRMRERARGLEIALDEERFRIACLASSRPRLEAQWETQRQLLPDSDHAGLASLLDRTVLTEEDLILLLSAVQTQFEPASMILERAAELAKAHQVRSFDAAEAATWLGRNRRVMYAELESRLTGFARCGIEAIDHWANTLRVQRRLPLARVLVMLSLPAAAWQQPPRQQYVENLLDFFEKRAASIAQRGPLVRLVIGKTTPRVDLFELASAKAPAVSLLDRFVTRSGETLRVDPALLTIEGAVTERLRRLKNHAQLYRRDTGVDGLYLGFPFVVMRAPGTPRPRIAPLFLWPAQIHLEIGSRSQGAFSFDVERMEVRLNPAIPTLFDRKDATRLLEILQELLQAPALTVRQVMDALSTVIEPQEMAFVRLPNKDFTLKGRTSDLVCSAVLFHAEFMGQAIAEDLRSLRRRSMGGTVLDAVIRPDTAIPSKGESTAIDGADVERTEREVSAVVASVRDAERYPVTEADPSQDAAVLKAREAPGLLIEGPPGTGKSQTIVNIVSDCIGRGQSVLVVCQKQVALQVVTKRLAAAHIGNRSLVVNDLTADRTRVITALREQLASLQTQTAQQVQTLESRRLGHAKRIQSIEAELDTHHQSLHAIDAATELSYRALLGELISMQDTATFIDAPGLRVPLGRLTPIEVAELQDVLEPLASDWMVSRYEDSPLAATRVFSADAAVAKEFRHAFVAFVKAEAERSKAVGACPDAYEVSEAAPHARWLEAHDASFTGLDERIRRHVGLWYDYFGAQGDRTSVGVAAIASLEALGKAVRALDAGAVKAQAQDRARAEELASWQEETVSTWRDRFAYVLEGRSIWARVNPKRVAARLKVNRFLKDQGVAERSPAALQHAERVLLLELALRPHRLKLLEHLDRFAGHPLVPDTVSAQGVAVAADQLLEVLRPLEALVAVARACPLAAEAERAIKTGQASAYNDFVRRYRGGLRQFAARQASLAGLHALRSWFPDAWLAERHEDIRLRRIAVETLQRIAGAIPRLTQYQNVRRRLAGAAEPVLECLKVLRRYEAALLQLPPANVPEAMRATLAREARLAWKDRLEGAHPALLLDRASMASRVKQLKDLDAKFVQVNRELLAAASGSAQRVTGQQWDAITRLRGPQARRLREFFEAGVEIGLLGLRPVWLMNPDVASRLLPLRAGLFDVVVFDEASQIPVEHALPALYRAKRAVVSGDEKQMPPTSFFTSRLESDEDELFDADEIDDAVTESARTALEEKWSRREIKDCEDLLTLARNCLPRALLEIHYRSNFRELIHFSNAAYYGGNLYVPVQNPEVRVKRNPPIVVKRVNGTYQNQLNEAEADAVVDIVAKIWKTAGARRPSLGVVTFNRKQADLILNRLDRRAQKDAEFKRALGEEGERIEDGEDMGFFVKNVENVQGDERDVVVFSTTFGLNESGVFRRTFGVLGQQGGERRLNVAITRARDKVILVTSMPVGEISDMMATGRAPAIARDYLQSYMDYASKVSDGDLASARSVASKCQVSGLGDGAATRKVKVDGFMASVAQYLQTLSVKAEATGDGLFGLDFAVEDPRSGFYVLGIECDAPSHGLLARARARDIWRTEVLRRSMPHIHRVSSHAWYHDRQREQELLAQAVRSAVAAGAS